MMPIMANGTFRTRNELIAKITSDRNIGLATLRIARERGLTNHQGIEQAKEHLAEADKLEEFLNECAI